MTNASLRIAVLIGSTREGRFGPNIAKWLVRRVAGHPDLEIDLIDLADVTLPAVLARHHGATEQGFVERIGRADGFVVITPEYNHGYPASLKQAIDVPHHEWRAKPVAFVSYGGMAGGLRAVEQLRQVSAELHATTVRDTVSFHNFFQLFDDAGELIEPEPADAAAKRMIDQLVWWARALRAGREAVPYAA